MIEAVAKIRRAGRLTRSILALTAIALVALSGMALVDAKQASAEGGAILLKINQLAEGCRVLSQARALDGVLGWLAAFKGALVAETEADAYLARAAARDPDIWVVEIEDRSGRNPFDGDIFRPAPAGKPLTAKIGSIEPDVFLTGPVFQLTAFQ